MDIFWLPYSCVYCNQSTCIQGQVFVCSSAKILNEEYKWWKQKCSIRAYQPLSKVLISFHLLPELTELVSCLWSWTSVSYPVKSCLSTLGTLSFWWELHPFNLESFKLQVGVLRDRLVPAQHSSSLGCSIRFPSATTISSCSPWMSPCLGDAQSGHNHVALGQCQATSADWDPPRENDGSS